MKGLNGHSQSLTRLPQEEPGAALKLLVLKRSIPVLKGRNDHAVSDLPSISIPDLNARMHIQVFKWRNGYLVNDLPSISIPNPNVCIFWSLNGEMANL